ncbi:hypothetical protein [Streptomyces nanshensis]|uniref:Uncharacterized protein n=1 Tax=Streptomyces nanshensis TaxID=518642 RepID=A0A1E7KZ95_9ACTN|nr:hypothetical protein [Streptomyces nanshensis]OEV09249.1 hypothetical protein AN218_22560 [Streptomyces nanshensis]
MPLLAPSAPTPPPQAAAPDPGLVIALARAAVDPDSFPGFSEFTSSDVALQHSTQKTVTVATDNRWAATAMRTALRRSGCAVEGDANNQTTSATVWAISHTLAAPHPELRAEQETDPRGWSIFLLHGPHGVIEQQCGVGGHSDLIAHAQHPFPGAARCACQRHGPMCWQRSDWPAEARVRRFIDLTHTQDGPAWRLSTQARQRMRALYISSIHQARPTTSSATFFVPTKT